MSIIHIDRSRVETFEHCPRKRFWLYEYQGRGLEKADNLKLDARIGTFVHHGIEVGLDCFKGFEAGEFEIQVSEDAGADFLKECMAVVDWSQGTEQLKHDVVEGGQIVTALVYAWLRVKAPRLLADGEVLGIEKELTVDFSVGADIVRLMARPDVIWRRKQDGTIFIRNLKTVRKADDRWREKWALDMQTLSEPLAVDNWLKVQTEPPNDKGVFVIGGASVPYDPSTICGGVIIDGLVTGEVLFDKYRGVFYHNNPLIYAWMGGDIGVVDGPPTFYPRYEWSCTAPHKFSNGRRCDGGKSHKLSGVRKVSVAEKYPGGVIAWIDYLIENDLALVEEMLVELPPIIRSDYQIERWKRQVLPREVQINRTASIINAGIQDTNGSGLVDVALDAAFPMHTANGNCLYPGQCAAHSLCHGSAAVDPLNSGYVVRIANHPQEGEK